MLHEPTRAVFSIFTAPGIDPASATIDDLRARLTHVCDGHPIPDKLHNLAAAAIDAFWVNVMTARCLHAAVAANDASKYYDIASSDGPLPVEVLAENNGLFVHADWDSDGLTVSAVSCGFNVARGFWFRSLDQAVGYMNAIAPLADWPTVTPETPIDQPVRDAVRRELRRHRAAAPRPG
jgi:hypothetical protein